MTLQATLRDWIGAAAQAAGTRLHEDLWGREQVTLLLERLSTRLPALDRPEGVGLWRLEGTATAELWTDTPEEVPLEGLCAALAQPLHFDLTGLAAGAVGFCGRAGLTSVEQRITEMATVTRLGIALLGDLVRLDATAAPPLPGQVYFGWTPRVGQAHEADYEPGSVEQVAP